MKAPREGPRWRAPGPRGLSFDEFRRLADSIVDKIPPRLCRDLNGGFVALPGEKQDGELLVLGEYVQDDLLGRRVVLYYGSFAALLGDSPRGGWEREVRKTVRHELRHHLESLAGVDDLAREDMEFLARFRKGRKR
ncbi:MAG: metallopeptidase family protein [Clostridia bacterium]|nr:metallopeptidase family protein [Clostridia bacterium]